MNKLTEVSVKNGYRATYNHYRKLVYPLFLILLLLLLTSPVQAKYSDGTGEPNNPYQIADANDMNEIGTHTEDWGSHFLLVNDINLAEYTGETFNIIGPNSATPFTGVFDGNGHTISNFTYTTTANYAAIFGFIDDPNAEVKNLYLIDPNVDAYLTGWYAGSLAGVLKRGSVSGCYAEGGRVLGSLNVGGLVGYNCQTLVDCHANIDVKGFDAVGGLVGYNFTGSIFNATISNCYSSGSVTGFYNVGGLVGWNIGDGIISDCNSQCIVSGGSDVGGLVGENEGTLSRCYSIGSVQGRENVGGLVGWNDSGATILDCYAAVDVNSDADSGNGETGGLVGRNSEAIISRSYSAGSVSGGLYVGGLVGTNYYDSVISNCYALGNVDGNERVGGLIGYNDFGQVAKCYSTGSVSGNSMVGGLIGFRFGLITDSFWDMETALPATGSDGGTGKTTTEMQTESTFTDAGWDFVGETVNGPNDFWKICDGMNYPKLAWQIPLLGDFDCPDGVEGNDLAALCEHWLLWKLSADVVPDGGDGIVNFLDYADLASTWQGTLDDMAGLAVFAEQWLQVGATSAEVVPFDIAPKLRDGVINWLDFAALANNWLAGIE